MKRGSHKVYNMTETANPLSNIGDMNPDAAQHVRQELDSNLELPDGAHIIDSEPGPCEDNSGDWVMAQVELTPDRVATIYALEGAYTFQMYDGEEFKEPTTSVEELSEQLANIQ